MVQIRGLTGFTEAKVLAETTDIRLVEAAVVVLFEVRVGETA